MFLEFKGVKKTMKVDTSADYYGDFSEFKRMLLLIFDKLQEYKDVE